MALWDLLTLAGDVFALVMFVAGVLAFAFRVWIERRIRHHFARAVGKELASHKHKLETELESHKAAILRELEEYRANIDIRRTLAIKMAEARLDALRDLAFAMEQLVHTACSVALHSPERRQQRTIAQYTEDTNAYRKALRSASIFIPQPLAHRITGTIISAGQLVEECTKSDEVLTWSNERIGEIIKETAMSRDELRELIHAAPDPLKM